MEFNPESCDAERLSVARSYGVDRVSLGIQSFDGELLDRIGRSHRAGTGESALGFLTGVPGLRVTADLMFNLPGQTLDGFLADLAHLMEFPLGHVSFYGLKVDPRTRLGHRVARGELSVDEDLYADMYRRGVEFLASRGLERYETSNFALPGQESLHNLNYWRRGEYLAFGPGAHGFFEGVRFHAPEKYAPWRNYVKSGCPRDLLDLDIVDGEALAAELIQLSLRTSEGLDLEILRKNGKNVPESVILRWEREGFLVRSGSRIALSGDGWLFMDRVVEDLFCNCVPYSNLE
jgi:oxygen-independent coproporphyrinogen-3 oxidase